MDVAAVCIGDELLDGRIRDRNVSVLGDFLEGHGSQLVDARLVPDAESRIVEALDEAAARAEAVVVTGGLGPTDDDRTRSAAAAWVDGELEFDEATLEHLQRLFDEHGYEFTPNNRRQCYFPEGAEILESRVGTAAGFALEQAGTRAWFLPGVPHEFEWFLDEHLAPRMREAEGAPSASDQLTFLGLGESSLETRIGPAVDLAEDRGVSVRFLPDAPLVTVRLRGPDREGVGAVRRRILDEIGDWLATEGDVPLTGRIGEALEARDETVATAESCTGGWLSKELTAVAGSSAWFEYGFVTYADEAKMRMLGVRPETLEAHGAVSPETVREMAHGAREYAEAEHAVAISGIAGPSGGTDAKPVGTVDFGLATPDGIYSRRFQFPPRGREIVRRRSVVTAAGLLLWYLEGRLEAHRVDGPAEPGDPPLHDGA